jgi:hypothetical protein
LLKKEVVLDSEVPESRYQDYLHNYWGHGFLTQYYL